MFDLLTTVEYGGCSAKLPADLLEKLLKELPTNVSPDLLVGTDTHDDAAVYRLNDSQAIIFTTDFFPPVCSDPYTFGAIAAANALSDVYAMGGQVLIALNLIMFPSKNIEFEALTQILKGGQAKVSEAGAMVVGGHTIDDFPPKYGLAVVGTIHPDRIITNKAATPGDVLILTKPIGTGTLMAGRRLKIASDADYNTALQSMTQLNKYASEVMSKHNVRCATDITGFSLLGHMLKMAMASGVCMSVDLKAVPLLPGAYALAELGCIPGASFRNQRYVEAYKIENNHLSYELQMLGYDAQTSGGLLMAVDSTKAEEIVKELQTQYPKTTIIGRVEELKDNTWIIF